MDAPIVLKTEALCKQFKVGFWGRPVTALERLDLEVHTGEIFGFLGPNGAGKTTTLKILMGLIYPTSGRAWILGHKVGEVAMKQQVGFLPESPYFYDYLTAEEFLRFYGQLFGLGGQVLSERITQLLHTVGLSDARTLQLRKFSKGMLQRVGIAQALINDPHLVILDEPMSGLDPVGRKEIRDLILQLKMQGKTVFFSSHILHDAEVLCDRVGILIKGRLVALGKVTELIGAASTQSVEIVVEGLDPEGVERLRTIAETVIPQGERLLAVLHDQIDEVLDLIRARSASLISVTPQQPSLEELFMREVRQQSSEEVSR
ncbi:MAG TPA: ABC transporter ATP-binding protein [Nitrospirales bacterium]|jgi:ABC-2 type transport system ATP-binding protein